MAKLHHFKKTDAFSSEIKMEGSTLIIEGEKIDLQSKEAMSHFERPN